MDLRHLILLKLSARGFINYVPYGIITITDKGRAKAEEKIYRHKTIANFLEHVLMVEPEKVPQNATQIEYTMSEDTLEKFVSFLTFMDKCSYKEPKWMNSYKHFAQNNEMKEKCLTCTGSCCCDCGNNK